MVDSLKLTVLSHPVTVKFVEAEDSLFAYGSTDRDSLTIRIKDGMSPSLLVAVLLHEIVHVGETILGYEFTEQEVDAIAATFYSLLRDNPKVWGLFNDAVEVHAKDKK